MRNHFRFRLSLLVSLFAAGLLVIFISSFKEKPISQPRALGEFIYTVRLEKFETPQALQTQWWHEYLPPNLNRKFLQPLLDAVDSGFVTTYEPVYPYTRAFSKSDAHKLVRSEDSIMVEDPNNPGTFLPALLQTVLTPAQIESVTFDEEWSYDEATLTLIKTVKGIVLNQISYDPITGAAGVKPLLFIRFDPKVFANDTGVNVDRITYDFMPENANPNADTLLASLKRAALRDETPLHDTLYPYNAVLSKKQKRESRALIPQANHLRFCEDWSIHGKYKSFVKYVRGVVLTDLPEQVVPFGNSPSVYRKTYIPLNAPAPVAEAENPQQEIFYPVVYRSPSTEEVVKGDTIAFDRFVTQLITQVRTQKLKAHDLWYEDPFDPQQRALLTPQEIEDRFVSWDSTNQVEDPNNPGTYMIHPLKIERTNEDMIGLRFYESWNFDLQKMAFQKNVRSIGLDERRIVFGVDGETYKPGTILNIDPNPIDKTTEIMKPQFLVASHFRFPVKINFMEEGEWLDEHSFGNVLNYDDHGFYDRYLDPPGRYALIDPVLQLALGGKLVVYDGSDTTKILKPSELKKRLDALKDSSFVRGDLPTEYTLLNEIIFDEDWYFNPATGQFAKHVNSITFSHRYPSGGEVYESFPVRREKVFTVKMKG